MNEYGLVAGRYPAVVKSYDQARRTCRVEIPGLTDGGDVLPEAEIEYQIGDKSRTGANSTEIEITPGDTVWIAFIGGDARYPIITGYRNPQSGNSVDWRRWHHKNMELIADALMRLIAQGDILIESGSNVTIKAPNNILLDAPIVTITGVIEILNQNNAGETATIKGNVQVEGNINATGSVMDGAGNSNHHSH